MSQNFENGAVTGTGATINISLGWVPKRVVVENFTSATLESLEWNDEMTDGHAYKYVSAGTKTKLTSLGISAYAGAESSAGAGFSIGADTDVNVAAEVIHWYAWR